MENRIFLFACEVLAWISILSALLQTVSGKESAHEFTLRSWLKPKLRKAQRSNSSGVHQVNYFDTIHAITGETIRMPCQNAERFFARFNHGKHFGKFVSPGPLCAFRFRELTDNLNVFSLGKFS